MMFETNVFSVIFNERLSACWSCPDCYSENQYFKNVVLQHVRMY